MDRYKRMEDNLGKLKRNLEGMTPEQKERYKQPLLKLKRQIAEDATYVMKVFLISGCRVLNDRPEDMTDLMESADRILQEDGKAACVEASKVLFETYDIGKFIECLLPIHIRIWFEAYAPVWIRNCQKTSDPNYPYRNEIIQMKWSAEHGIWESEDGRSFTLILPPTRELVNQAYENEKRGMEDERRQKSVRGMGSDSNHRHR